MNNYFKCITDKNPVSYLPGETVLFHVFYQNEEKNVSAPLFQWILTGDFGLRKEGTADGKSGTFEISASLDRPGFIFLKVWATDKDGTPLPDSDTLFAGAGVGIRKITSVTERPSDYDAFWERCREQMISVNPVLLEKKELEKDPLYPDHDHYDVKIQCFGNAPVSGILTIPRDGKKHPGRVIYQGYGVKSAWHDFDKDEIQLCINAHGIENDMPEEYYNNLVNGRLKRYGFNPEENKSPDTCYFKNMMIRAGQALRYLKSLPEWDGKGLYVRGGSQGAVQCMHASFLVPEVNDMYIFVPWLCDTAAGKIGRLCGWGEFDFVSTPYFDLALRAEKIHSRILIEAGLGDYTSPPAGVMAMYNNLRCEKKLIYIQSREHIYCSPAAENFEV